MWLPLFITLASFTGRSSGINCYKCTSINGSHPFCEDPIDASLAPYSEHCKVPMKEHNGLFPANFCLKIVGINTATYERLVIRECAIRTMDSQCGVFRYENDEMSGCVLTCEFSGCNTATLPSVPAYLSLLLPLFASISYFRPNTLVFSMTTSPL